MPLDSASTDCRAQRPMNDPPRTPVRWSTRTRISTTRGSATTWTACWTGRRCRRRPDHRHRHDGGRQRGGASSLPQAHRGHLRGRRHPPQRRGRSRPTGLAGDRSTWSTGPASSPSARPGWTATGTAPRSRCSKNGSTATSTWPTSATFRSSSIAATASATSSSSCGRSAVRSAGSCTRSPGPGTTPRRSSSWACTSRSPAWSRSRTRASTPLRDVAARVPLDRLLVETDSPYLSPHPFRGQTNEPARVALTAERLAEIRGLLARRVRPDHHDERAQAVPSPRRQTL